uniref:Uncharacterized protein n=1 Tax=Sphaerodactylus townsendi TaxID=933632 RepID=A0ACB8EN73_9SAUR
MGIALANQACNAIMVGGVRAVLLTWPGKTKWMAGFHLQNIVSSKKKRSALGGRFQPQRLFNDGLQRASGKEKRLRSSCHPGLTWGNSSWLSSFAQLLQLKKIPVAGA